MTTKRQLADLKPNPRNPRTITPKKLDMLRDSLARFGDISGVIVNRRSGMQLIGGHQRVVALTKMADGDPVIDREYDEPTITGTVAEGHISMAGERFGYREVDWDDATEKAACIAANKGAGEWDVPQLKDWLGELDAQDFSLDLTMFDADERLALGFNEIADMNDDVDGETYQEDVPVETGIQMGDVYEMGIHRLMCADSTSAKNWSSLMPDETCDVVITSPPYDQQRTYTKEMEPWRQFMAKVFSAMPFDNESQILVNLGLIYRQGCWVDYWNDWICDMRAAGWRNAGWYVWDQGAPYPGTDHGRLRSGHEWIFHLNKQKPNVTQTVPCVNKGEVYTSRAGRRPDGKRKHMQTIKTGNLRVATSVISVGRDKTGQTDHPAVFPVELPRRLIASFRDNGHTVVEPFSGSGSTLIACEREAKACRAMEWEPTYCQMAINRWERQSGQRAVLVERDGQPVGNGVGMDDA